VWLTTVLTVLKAHNKDFFTDGPNVNVFVFFVVFFYYHLIKKKMNKIHFPGIVVTCTCFGYNKQDCNGNIIIMGYMHA